LREKERPVRGTKDLEFPQGYAESMEKSIKTGIRELMEETGLSSIDLDSIVRLQDICPEPDWFLRAPAVVAIDISLPSGYDKSRYNTFGIFELPSWSRRIDSATTLAALLRFIVWAKDKQGTKSGRKNRPLFLLTFK